jgi:hypothetical protein
LTSFGPWADPRERLNVATPGEAVVADRAYGRRRGRIPALQVPLGKGRRHYSAFQIML